MKKYSDKEKLTYYRKRVKILQKALDRAYSDIIWFINYGDFKEEIEWDAGYIIDALPRRRKKTPKSSV